MSEKWWSDLHEAASNEIVSFAVKTDLGFEPLEAFFLLSGVSLPALCVNKLMHYFSQQTLTSECSFSKQISKRSPCLSTENLWSDNLRCMLEQGENRPVGFTIKSTLEAKYLLNKLKMKIDNNWWIMYRNSCLAIS